MSVPSSVVEDKDKGAWSLMWKAGVRAELI